MDPKAKVEDWVKTVDTVTSGIYAENHITSQPLLWDEKIRNYDIVPLCYIMFRESRRMLRNFDQDFPPSREVVQQLNLTDAM